MRPPPRNGPTDLPVARLRLGRGALLLLSVVFVLDGAGGLGVLPFPHVVDHIYQVSLAAALVGVCLAVGRRLLGLFRVDTPDPLDRLLVSVVLGAGALSVVFLAVGLTGLLSTPVLVAILVLAAGWARRELWGIPRFLGRVAGAVPRSVMLIAGLIGLALVVRGLMPPTDWDSLMYHLHLPEEFLEQGRIFLPGDTLHVAFTGSIHMLYLPLLALGGASAPALLSVAFGLMVPLAVYRLGRRVAGEISAEMAGIAIWGTAAVALVAATPRVDLSLVLFLTVAHGVLYGALADQIDWRRLLLAAVLLGLSVTVKYQAGAYILGLSPLIVWSLLSSGSDRRTGWRAFLAFGGVLAAVALPWFAKNWLLLDAPFYPFLADLQLPPWLSDLHGTRSVPSSVDIAAFGALSEVRRPFDIVDAFLDPGSMSPEAEAAHYHLSPLLLLLPAWVAWIRDRDLAWLLVPGLGYVAVVLSVSPRTNLRYLLPAVPPLTVAASALAVRILGWGLDRFGPEGEHRAAGTRGAANRPAPRERRLTVAALALAAASLIPTGLSLYRWLPGEVSMAHLAGLESRTAYLSQRRSPAMVVRAGLTEFGERPMPDDARVLMLFEAREYHFGVPALQDPLLTNWALLAPLRGRLGCLRAADVTHVLVATGVLDYYFRRGLRPRTVRWPSFESFADECLVRELEASGFTLYRIAPPPEQRPPARGLGEGPGRERASTAADHAPATSRTGEGR